LYIKLYIGGQRILFSPKGTKDFYFLNGGFAIDPTALCGAQRSPIQPLLELGNSLKKKKMRYQTIQYHREPLQMIKI
jgi:hypothetical protein